MDTDKHRLICQDITGKIIGCGMEVLNILGHGLLEKSYENALTIEFTAQGIAFRQQVRFPVVYKGKTVGEYIPDLIVEDQVIVEVKTVEHIGRHEYGQLMNYLKITGLRVGLLLNFHHAKMQWKRIVV